MQSAMPSYRLCTILCIALVLLLGQAVSPGAWGGAPRGPQSAFSAPVLKWQRGGCYSSWCETGWYSSPAVADLDGDGKPEVIAASYSIFVLDGATGALEHSIDPPGGRQWPSLVVADLEGDGDLEIVTAHGEGYLHVFDHNLNLVWSRQPTPGNELRSLATYDLDGNGDLEIIVASTRSENQWYVYEHNGAVRAGSWPQHSPDSDTNGYTAGCFNENVAAGDLDGDGRGEIVGPNDTHYLAAFEDNGAQIRASTIYGTNPDATAKFWSQVGVHLSHAVDLRGYAHCGTEHRPNFAHSAPIIMDINGDGVLEAIVVGNVYNCGTSPYTDLYEMPYILKGDRTRWSGNGFDWTAIPVPDVNARPLSEDYNLIENNQPNPVAADLDGDGFLEILHSSYDGRVHAYWLDKSEHGAWPYSVYKPAEGYFRFASEPVVADLDNNGKAEVIFASWPQKGTNQTGKLHILDDLGNPLYEVALPVAFGGANWNGALAAPTLANIDADTDLEVVLNTAHSGVVAYDLPGTANVNLIWPTGRGNYQRSGSLVRGTLVSSTKSASRVMANPGDSLAYTITLRNPGPALPSVVVTDSLPSYLTYEGGLSASSGNVSYAGGVVHWDGAVDSSTPVTMRFDARISAALTTPRWAINTAQIDDSFGNLLLRQALTMVGLNWLYLPLIRH